MKNAVIFPGQGSQKVGMGKDIADVYPAAKHVFDEVDEAIGIKLSSIIWEGELDQLTLTENAQPALMAHSLAIIAALRTEGIDIDFCDFLAGHSLGEYSALCASGAISIKDTAILLRKRGLAMQSCVKPGEGAMAALLGLSAAQVGDILSNYVGNGTCQIANDNDPNQVVISGNRIDVDAVIELAKTNGARRALHLNVSAPFHCELMAPAADEMKKSLAEVKIIRPKVPVVMNVLAEAVVEPEQIRKLLVEQIVGMVRWRESVEYMHNKGTATFYEVGAGKALSGMVKRISTGVRIENISAHDDIVNMIERMSNDKTK